MKLNPVILIIVVALAIYIGINSNGGQSSATTDEIETTNLPKEKEMIEQAQVQSSGLTPNYLMNTLSENGFEILPKFKGTTCDIYTGKMKISDSNVIVQVDVYHERSSGEVLLVETNIDASAYVDHSNQKEVEDLVNKVANNFFIPLASIPYKGSEPEAAGTWVKSNLLTSYSVEPKEKTSTKIGPATINIFGNPLFRTLEIDFGFAD